MDTQQNFNSAILFPTRKLQLSFDDQLIEAVRSQDLSKIKQLIDSGAKADYIQNKKHGENRHSSTQTSVLYEAIHANSGNQVENYVKIIQYLLQKGADPTSKCRVNKWTRCQQLPLLKDFAFTLTKIKEQKLITKLLNIMASYGVDLNEPQDYRNNNNRVKDYRSHHCLAMELAQYCSLPSRIQHLKTKFRPFNVRLLKQQLQKDIVVRFDEQNKTDLAKQYYQQQQQYLQSQQQQWQNNKQNGNLLPIQINQSLLDLGVDADSYNQVKCNRKIKSSDEDVCSGEDQDSNEDQSDSDSDSDNDSENSNSRKRKRRSRSKSRNSRKYKNKYKMQSTTTRQNLLHRAIMNNSTQMVQLLIRKGADVNEECRFTVQLPIYPHEWKQKYRQRLIENNRRQLKDKQIQKQECEADLKQTTDPQKIKTLKQCILGTDFEIYKLQRFAIQNCCPRTKYKIVRLGCVELAESMQVSTEIIHMLKNAKEIYEEQRRRKKSEIKELKHKADCMERKVQQDGENDQDKSGENQIQQGNLR